MKQYTGIKEIRFAKVNQFFKENPDEFTDSMVIPQDEILTEWDTDPAYWVGEANDTVLSEILNFGDITPVHDENNRLIGLKIPVEIIWDESWFNHAQEITNSIMDAYDGDDPDGIWQKYGLGGDDDVDYNGSYLDMFVGLIQQYVFCYRCNMELI